MDVIPNSCLGSVDGSAELRIFHSNGPSCRAHQWCRVVEAEDRCADALHLGNFSALNCMLFIQTAAVSTIIKCFDPREEGRQNSIP